MICWHYPLLVLLRIGVKLRGHVADSDRERKKVQGCSAVDFDKEKSPG